VDGFGVSISNATLQIIGDLNPHHKDPESSEQGLLDPLLELKGETGLGLYMRYIESETLSSGDYRVSVVYYLDNNENADDGRINLRDEFVLAKNDRSFKGFFRRISPHGSIGEDSPWQTWLKAYQDLRWPTESEQREFSNRVIRHQGIPIRDNPELVQAIQKNNLNNRVVGFLRKAMRPAKEIDAKLALFPFDPESHYSAVGRGSEWEITVATVLDRDNNAGNGRVFLINTFVLDWASRRLKSFDHRWEAGWGSHEDAASLALAEKLNKKPKPSMEEAGRFIGALLPTMFSMPPPPARRASPAVAASPAAAGKSNAGVSGLDSLQTGPVSGPEGTTKSGTVSSAQEGGLSFGPYAYPSRRAGPRKDRMEDSVGGRIATLSRPHYNEAIAGQSFNLRCQVDLKVDNHTGNITAVSFVNVNAGAEPPSSATLEKMFRGIANKLQKNLSFAKKFEDSEIQFQVPLNFLPQS
jgi:hypothetical protein